MSRELSPARSPVVQDCAKAIYSLEGRSDEPVGNNELAERLAVPAGTASAMAPALVVLGVGLDPTTVLVISQVILSFGIASALVPTILLTRRRDLMGALVNRPWTTAAATAVAAVIISLNAFLLFETFFG